MHGQQDGLGHGPLRQLSVRAAFLLLAALAAPAGAAERTVFIGSFERLRVEGPYKVTVTTGRSPAARASGDPRLLDQLAVRLDGRTLVVRPTIGPRDQSAARDAAPVTVTLATPVLGAASVIGGGMLTVAGGRAARLDLAVTGAGSIAWTGADADRANATVIGTGRIALAGRAARARLMVNGDGRIEADKLAVGDLTVTVDGPGAVLGQARFTAGVTNTGLGQVTIAGAPKCQIRNPAGGPVTCGARPAATP